MSRIDNRLSQGLTPLSYEGVRPESSILVFSNDRKPTINDTTFLLGTLWIDRTYDETWILVDLSRGIATWRILASPSAFPMVFTCNYSYAVPSSGVLNFIGDGTVTTSGALDTLTINVGQGTDGQVLIGADSGAMVLANITEGSGVTITNGPNSILIEDNGGGGIASLDSDSGSAAPAGSNIQIAGGTNITTSAAGDTLDIDLDNNVAIAGTFKIASFGVGVLQTDFTGVVSSNTDTNGKVLIGADMFPPAWAEITSPTGSISITYPAPNTIDIRNAGSVGITDFTNDTGASSEAAGNINVLGGTNIVTTAAADHLDIALDADVTLAGTLTLPWSNGVLFSGAAGDIIASNGTNGQVIIAGGTVPAWNAITSTTLTITKAANSITISDATDYPLNSIFSWKLPIYGGYTYHYPDLKFPAGIDQYIGPDTSIPAYIDSGNVWTLGAIPYWTAPVTGKYFIHGKVNISCIYNTVGIFSTKVTNIRFVIKIITSNRWYYHERNVAGLIIPHNDGSYITDIPFSIITDMDAGDTCRYTAYYSVLPGGYPIINAYHYGAVCGYVIV